MSVKIYVKEKYSKLPVWGVMVRIENMELCEGICEVASTDMVGLAEFNTISDNKYNIKIRHKDYRPYTERMYISRNSIININLNKAFD